MFKKSMTVVSSFVILVNLIFLCIFFFFTTKISENFVERKVFESNKILCDAICTKLLAKLDASIVTSRMMAQDSFLLDFLRNEGELKHDEEVMKEYLSRIKDEFGYSQATLISTKTHRYYRDDEMHKIVNPQGDSHDLWFNQFEQSKIEYAFNVYRSPSGLESSSLYSNFRIDDDDGTFLGVASPAFALEDIIAFIAELEKTYNVKINTTDASGVVLLDSDYSQIANSSFAYLIEDGLSYRKKGFSGFVASQYIPNLDWYLVIRSDGDGIKDSSQLFYLVSILLFALDLLVLFSVRTAFHGKKEILLEPKENIDSLTGLANRNYFKEQLGERGYFNTTTYKCIAVFDIDYFKEANDNLNGDEALLSVVKTMSALLSNNGVILRWGGDEFVVLFEMGIEKAYKICKEFCKQIEEGKMITVSVGLTAINLFDNIKTNYHRAARYCYQVKEIGGNGVKKD